VYNLGSGTVSHSLESYFYPLQQCIQTHAQLCVVARDTQTDKAFLERVPTIDLGDHISIIGASGEKQDESAAIEGVLAQNVDRPFPPGIPSWRVVVLKLQPSRCFIAFAYSHSVMDGLSGAAFHRTFLKACLSNPDGAQSAPQLVTTPKRPLPAPLDTPGRLPISWSFLLRPRITLFIPKTIADWLGVQVHIAPVNDGTWTGAPVSFHPQNTHSKIKLQTVSTPVLEKAIRTSRLHDAKLTGTLHQLIARALSQAITDPAVTNFVCQTTVNMRQSIGKGEDDMGEIVSGCYSSYPRPDCSSLPLSSLDWKAAANTTRSLAETASTLQDQPIGLLRYLPSMREWLVGKIGQRRDSSFEVSNLGSFDPSTIAPAPGTTGKHVRIESMIFGTPGLVVSSPLAFNFSGIKGGDLNYTVAWRKGALGVAEEEEERFVESICSSLTAGLQDLR
jgi:hypothetical protein